MAFDAKEMDEVIAKVRTDLDVLQGVERTPIGGFVVATEHLSAIKDVPGNQLKLHPADLKGMRHFKTRENAEEIARFWNDKVTDKGPEYQPLRVRVMTKKEHLLALIPHYRSMLESFEKTRQAIIDNESA